MSGISKVFRELASRREGALVAYVMGGDPSPAASERVADAVVRGGADILEVGIPFSDPIADGPSIQAAGVRALAAGTTPKDVLAMAKGVKERHGVPVLLMTYFNILYSQGVERFLSLAKGNGVDGIIVPDLPLDEVGGYAAQAAKAGIDAVLLAAPTTPPARMRLIAEHSAGFLYLVSLLGVTGARASLREGTAPLIREARRFTGGRVPLAVGFGISRPEHVRGVLSAGADAAIVGSGIVDRVASNLTDEPRMLAELESYVSSLKRATRRA